MAAMTDIFHGIAKAFLIAVAIAALHDALLWAAMVLYFSKGWSW
jgi:hypothetical protein